VREEDTEAGEGVGAEEDVGAGDGVGLFSEIEPVLDS